MKSATKKKLISFVPYVLSATAVIAIVIVGSIRSSDASGNPPILSALNESGFTVSTDQYSESLMVASLSSTLALPSAAANSEDYVSVLVSYKLGQLSSSPVLEKPNIIDTSNLNRDIISYTVQGGDSLAGIASHFGVSTTDIRWSNNLKTDNINVGTTLYIPPEPGILYTVKEGDTLDGLATKYQSNAEEIEIYNDLEKSGLIMGATILIPGGVLPNTERPEYVAPTLRPTYTNYITNSNSRTRQNLRRISSDVTSANCPGNPGSFGQCTWYAWCWRMRYMPSNYWLPTGRIGNAGTWTSTYNPARIPYLFYIDREPRYGDVVQTDTGSPGHVGIVTNVNSGISITIREMNYAGRNVVTEAEIPWATAKSYNYIHQRK